MSTPIERIKSWWEQRQYTERPCKHPACSNTTTLVVSKKLGHVEFCSGNCASDHQADYCI